MKDENKEVLAKAWCRWGHFGTGFIAWSLSDGERFECAQCGKIWRPKPTMPNGDLQ